MPRTIVYPHKVKALDHRQGLHPEPVSGCPLCPKVPIKERIRRDLEATATCPDWQGVVARWLLRWSYFDR